VPIPWSGPPASYPVNKTKQVSIWCCTYLHQRVVDADANKERNTNEWLVANARKLTLGREKQSECDYTDLHQRVADADARASGTDTHDALLRQRRRRQTLAAQGSQHTG
jgi:hypothetical protein